jgi:DNA-binding GntR family transcriptional regulator
MALTDPSALDADTDGLTGPRTLTSAIYARLRADILAGRHRPSEKLLIAPIGKRFSVSLAAVREALSRLVADGLVIAEDQRGFRVSPLSLADLHDVTHTRIELECLALRRSIARGDAGWERELEAAWDALRRTPHDTAEERLRHSEAWSVLHGRFHHALVAACGLEWLLRFRATLYEQSERYRLLGRVVAGAERDVTDEHRRIVEAALARDADAAEAELARHFRRTADIIAAACSDEQLGGLARS